MKCHYCPRHGRHVYDIGKKRIFVCDNDTGKAAEAERRYLEELKLQVQREALKELK